MVPSSYRKIFAVGDIHGCRQKLENLLGQLPYDRERDLLIFLGDYINRGPQTREVIDPLCELKYRGGHLVTLMGNHEYLLLEYQQSGDPALIPLLRKLQIETTLASYGLMDLSRLHRLDGLPGEHRQFLAELRHSYESERHIFVHAGLRNLGTAPMTRDCETSNTMEDEGPDSLSAASHREAIEKLERAWCMSREVHGTIPPYYRARGTRIVVGRPW